MDEDDGDRGGMAPSIRMSSLRRRPLRWFKLKQGNKNLVVGVILFCFVPKQNGDKSPGTGEIHAKAACPTSLGGRPTCPFHLENSEPVK